MSLWVSLFFSCLSLGVCFSHARTVDAMSSMKKPSASSGERFAGSIDDVAARISRFADRPDFLRYGENMGRTKLDARALIVHRGLWRELYAVHPRICWPQTLRCCYRASRGRSPDGKRIWPAVLALQISPPNQLILWHIVGG